MYVVHQELATAIITERRAEAAQQRLAREVVRARRRARRDEREAVRFRLALTRSRVARQH